MQLKRTDLGTQQLWKVIDCGYVAAQTCHLVKKWCFRESFATHASPLPACFSSVQGHRFDAHKYLSIAGSPLSSFSRVLSHLSQMFRVACAVSSEVRCFSSRVQALYSEDAGAGKDVGVLTKQS